MKEKNHKKKYKYNVRCKVCEKEFVMMQKGDDISFLMDYIMHNYHVKNTIDEINEHYPDKNDCKNIKINLEIFENKECVKQNV